MNQPPDKLQSLFDACVNGAISEYAHEGSIEPRYVLENDNYVGVARLGPGWATTTRDETLASLREVVQEEGVFQYAHLAEVWMITRPGIAKTSRVLVDNAAVHDDPKKLEAVLVFAEDKDHHTIVGTLLVDRSTTPPTLKPYKMAADVLVADLTLYPITQH